MFSVAAANLPTANNLFGRWPMVIVRLYEYSSIQYLLYRATVLWSTLHNWLWDG
jgi:hypothetical protein